MAIFEITLLFLGTIIGAGFATGAEIVTFFGRLQLPVWCIATNAGLTMFAIISLEIFLNYPKAKPKRQSINSTTHDQKSTKFADFVFVIIYLILFTAMTAGITQITNSGICMLSLIISIGIVLFGFHGLTRFNSYIVLTIIILIITTAIPRLLSTPFPITTHRWDNFLHAVLWGLLYAGLNCFMFPELITAAAQTHPRKTLFWAGIITAGLVTILIGLILSTIQAAGTQNTPIPLLAATPSPITTIVILLAVLTSQYAALFAIMQRIQKLLPITKKKPLFAAIIICITAFAGSFCGFNYIIKYAYPLIGVFTCFYLLFSLLKFWFSGRHWH